MFCAEAFGGNQGDVAMGSKVAIQLYAALVTIVFTGILTFVILKVTDALVGLRVNEEDETQGLDIALHEETGYRY